MDIALKKGILIVRHKLAKNESYKFTKSDKFQTISIFKKPKVTQGFSNCCEDSRYIPVLDYDNTYKKIVLEDVKILQERYDLPPFYLFTTKEEKVNGEDKGNYHLINLKKFNYNDILWIITESRCDERYKSMNMRSPYKSWVLRIGSKDKRGCPRFLSIIGDIKNLDEEISSAHLEMLKKIYPKIKDIDYTHKDNLKILKLQEYET